VAIVRFDRPPANALDLEAVTEIGETVQELSRSGEVSGVVLTGAGGFFSAGLDLKLLSAYSADQRRELISRVNEMVATTYEAPVPLIAAINGHATAGGLVFALLCEHRLVARGSIKIGLSEVRVGIPFPAASLEVIKAEISPSILRRLVLRGAYIDPVEALAAGVVDEVVGGEKLLERAVELGEELGSMPRDGYIRIKSQIRGPVIARLREIRTGAYPTSADWDR
jgi:enoyl-CoA hydratase